MDVIVKETLLPIEEVAGKLGLGKDRLYLYGPHMAKVLGEPPKAKGRLILVTAITPTPAGEGKTTTAIGLVDALWRLGKKAALALREPSLGPVFGVKGGPRGAEGPASSPGTRSTSTSPGTSTPSPAR